MGGALGLKRLNPTRAVALHGTPSAGTRRPSVFETLEALLRQPSPVPQAMPEIGAVGQTVRGFMAAHRRRTT